MQRDPEIPLSNASPRAGSVPPVLRASDAGVIGASVPSAAVSPPPLPSKPDSKSWAVRQTLAILLSLCLGLFLADAVVSLVDNSLILLFDIRALAQIQGIVFFLALL